jgi:hypothetical protein
MPALPPLSQLPRSDTPPSVPSPQEIPAGPAKVETPFRAESSPLALPPVEKKESLGPKTSAVSPSVESDDRGRDSREIPARQLGEPDAKPLDAGKPFRPALEPPTVADADSVTDHAWPRPHQPTLNRVNPLRGNPRVAGGEVRSVVADGESTEKIRTVVYENPLRPR